MFGAQIENSSFTMFTEEGEHTFDGYDEHGNLVVFVSVCLSVGLSVCLSVTMHVCHARRLRVYK